jgi:hypothetical protein
MKLFTKAVFLLLGLLLSLPALSNDLAVEALEGAWVVQVGDQPRDRFLIVSDVKREQNRILAGRTSYGWIDGKGKPVREWQAEIFGDSIRLGFYTPAESRIDVVFRADETSVAGEMATKQGKKLDIRMTRLADEELALLRASAAESKKGASRPTKLQASKQSKIYLVYVGADDCPPCRRFSATYGNGKRLGEISPALAEARFVTVSLWSFRDPVTATNLPDELKWLAESVLPSGKPPLRKRGTPFFAAVLDKTVLAQGHGTTALETLVAPQIANAVELRRAAR